MSKYFHKFNIFFGLKIGFIILISVIYFVLKNAITEYSKDNYKKFNLVIEEVNNVYFDSFKILVTLKEQIENFAHYGNKLNLKIPKDSELEKPKLGNALMNIIKSNKYSEKNKQIIQDLYNNNACEVLAESDEEYNLCENIISSILTKGMEQAIVQMNIIITNSIDELNSLKQNKTLEDIFNGNSSYIHYEILVGYYMFKSFLKTNEIFEIFRNEEEANIKHFNKLFLIFYCVFYILLIIFMIYLIYDYKNVSNSFFNFIGILPSKFIIDDNNLYRTILKLDKKFY